jgi:hypothetical protein
MIETVLHPRTENKDWATALFVLSFAIAITKSVLKIDFVILIYIF